MIYMIYFAFPDERQKSVSPFQGRKFTASYQAYQNPVMGGQVSFSRLGGIEISPFHQGREIYRKDP